MATVQEVLAEVQGLKTDLTAKLDSIDGVIETLRAQVAAGQVDAGTIDQIASEVQAARTSLAAVNPEDPSGDDAPAAEPPPAA